MADECGATTVGPDPGAAAVAAVAIGAERGGHGVAASGESLTLRGRKGRRLQRGAASRNTFGAAKRETFIEVLASTSNVRLAAATCGTATTTACRMRRTDAGFAAQWDAALLSGYQRLEAEALRYALERLPEAIDPHADGTDTAARAAIAGSATGALTQRRASDAELRFVLAILGRHPRVAKGVGGGEGAVGAVVPSEADTDARLVELLDKLERRRS